MIRIPLVVEYDGEQLQEVVADQRDQAAFERAERMSFSEGWKTLNTVTMRTLAFEALKRQGLLGKDDSGKRDENREAWERRAVHVHFGRIGAAVEDEADEADDQAEDPDRVDPGRWAASGAAPLSSPSRAAKASRKSSPGGKTKT